MSSEQPLSPSSAVVSVGRPNGPGAPLNAPIVSASTFRAGGEFGYARDEGTPTWLALEAVMSQLEGGTAVAFASGMAAVSAVFAALPVGGHVLWPDDCYQGVAGVISDGEIARGWTSERLPTADTDAWLDRLPSADLVWLESPSNPLLEIADVERICSGPRKPGSIIAVDNTLATPLNQRPLQLGADVSVTATTKYVGGHSDLLGGIVVTNSDDIVDAVRRARLLGGATPGALESFLATRGVRTLAIRLDRAQSNAALVAERLEAHPAVERVRYPGLPSHPQHELAQRVLDGPGTMISFDIAGGAEPAERFLDRLELILHATSFGAVESTIERRAAVPGQEHLPPGLVRFSVGIEDAEDLWSDLDAALGGG